jgi:hypothetical protein
MQRYLQPYAVTPSLKAIINLVNSGGWGQDAINQFTINQQIGNTIGIDYINITNMEFEITDKNGNVLCLLPYFSEGTINFNNQALENILIRPTFNYLTLDGYNGTSNVALSDDPGINFLIRPNELLKDTYTVSHENYYIGLYSKVGSAINLAQINGDSVNYYDIGLDDFIGNAILSVIPRYYNVSGANYDVGYLSDQNGQYVAGAYPIGSLSPLGNNFTPGSTTSIASLSSTVGFSLYNYASGGNTTAFTITVQVSLDNATWFNLQNAVYTTIIPALTNGQMHVEHFNNIGGFRFVRIINSGATSSTSNLGMAYSAQGIG